MVRGKELSTEQLATVVDAQNTSNPLYLKIVLEVGTAWIIGQLFGSFTMWCLLIMPILLLSSVVGTFDEHFSSCNR